MDDVGFNDVLRALRSFSTNEDANLLIRMRMARFVKGASCVGIERIMMADSNVIMTALGRDTLAAWEGLPLPGEPVEKYSIAHMCRDLESITLTEPCALDGLGLVDEDGALNGAGHDVDGWLSRNVFTRDNLHRLVDLIKELSE